MDLSIQDKIEKCLSYIKRKEYDLARHELSKCIYNLKSLPDAKIKHARVEMGLTEVPSNGCLYHPKIIILLDYRAKVYVKLGEFNKAYSDASSIIDYQPYSAKGYLCCGQVLELENDINKAFYIYNLGVTTIQSCSEKNVGISRKLLSQLIKKRNEAQARIKKRKCSTEITGLSKRSKVSAYPRKRLDLFTILPTEILIKIFKYIPTNDIVKNCFYVSKIWKSKLSKIPDFYQRFLFKHSLTVKNFMLFLNFLRICKKDSYAKSVDNLSIQNISSGSEGYILRKLFDSPFQIKDLQLNLFETELYSLIECLQNSDGLLKTKVYDFKLGIHTTPLYEEEILIELPNLAKLSLYVRNGKDKGTSSEIMLNQHIKSKVLHFNRDLERKKDLAFEALTELEIIGDKRQTYLHGKIPFFNSFKYKRLNSLKSLIIVGLNFSHILQDSDHASDVLNGMFQLPQLVEIFVEGCTYLSFWHVLKNIPLPNKRLESITFRDYFGTSLFNEIENPVTSYCLERLNRLDLYDTYLPFKDLMKILKSCKTLEYLNIGGKGFYQFPKHINQQTDSLHNLFNFDEFFNVVPNLIDLRLPGGGSSWDDNNMKMFRKAVIDYEKNHSKNPLPRLRTLDLSFSNVTGFGLLEFFAFKIKKKKAEVKSSIGIKVRKINSNSLTNVNNDSIIDKEDIIPFQRLKKLILDGVVNISSSTIKDLIKHKYVEKIQYDTNRTAWPLFGQNSRFNY